MSYPRLCIQYSDISPGIIIELSKQDRRYLFNVLRCSKGDSISIFDGRGKSFKAKIINEKNIEVLEEEELHTEDIFSIVLCQALLKGEKMDMIIQKATEMGVKKIIPFVSERCIVKDTQKIERWRKIAKEASEQAYRTIVPEIVDVVYFGDLIKKIENGILFWEKAQTPLIEIISTINPQKEIFLLVGPEGGFTHKEVTQAKKKQIKIATLGKRILRAETASIVSVSLMSFLIEWKIKNYDII